MTPLSRALEQFDEKVRELKNNNEFNVDGDTDVSKFGFKTIRGNEVFTVTDFGHIKSFISDFYRQILTEDIERIEGEMEELPKDKCLNLEMHLTGRCFDCEKTKARNEQRLSEITHKKQLLEANK